MDETEIELRDVTQYLMPPPHSSTERVCLATRWAGIFLSTTALGLVRPAFQQRASCDELQLRQTVKLKRDFTFLMHVDQHPDLIVARPAARATYSVTATLYAPIRSQIRSGCHGGTPTR